MSSFSAAFTALSTIQPQHTGKLYLVTNEVGAGDTIKIAKQHPVQDATVVLFTSGMFGLNYASARGIESLSDRRIQHLISLDYSQSVKEFWELVTPAIHESIDAADCARKVHSLVMAHAAKFFPPTQLNDSESVADQWLKMLSLEISLGESWLSTDEQFQMIKNIFTQNNFVHLTVDLRSVESISPISAALQELDLKIDSLYLSNVAEFFTSDELRRYQIALQQFQINSIPSTFFIDTLPRKRGIRLRSSKQSHQRIQQTFNDERIEMLLAYIPPQLRKLQVAQSSETNE